MVVGCRGNSETSFEIYGIEMCANTYPSYLRKVETLNNKLLLILQNKPHNSPSNNLYIDYNTLSVLDLHIYQILLFVYKSMYHRDIVCQAFSVTIFRLSNIVHDHDTHGSNDLHVTAVNNNYGRRSITHKASTLWTNLFTALKEYSPINKFSKKI